MRLDPSPVRTPLWRARLALTATVALAALLLLPAFDEASAASFRQRMSARTKTTNHSMVERSLQSNRARVTRKTTGKTELGSHAGDGRRPGRRPGTTNIVVNGGSNGTTGPNGGRHPPKGDGGTKTGDGGRKPPRWPHRPGHPHWPPLPIGPSGPPDIVVTNPGGGGGGTTFVPPSTASGGGQPPSNFTSQVTKRTGSGVPPNNERRYVPDEVVIEVLGNFSEQAASALALRHRLARLQRVNLTLTGTTLFRWRIPDRRTVPQVVRALEADGAVLSAQPNYIATLSDNAALGVVANPVQYAPAKLNVPRALELATGNRVLVAVVDSGVDASHPELAGMVADSFDAVESAVKARPSTGKAAVAAAEKVHSHGTGVAGAIVGHAKMMGIAPAARILAVRSFAPTDTSSEGTTFSIQEGINWAVLKGARVINMSFAGAEDPAIARSLAAAHERGIVLVAAVGNNGPNAAPQYPAANPYVIAVTATDADDKLFKAAVRGKHIAVAAPGVEIYLPTVGGIYQLASGTSFSAPEVAGVVALMIERRPDLDPDTIRRILMSTAHDLGPKGQDPQFGAGLVDAYRALLSLEPEVADTAAQVIPAAVRP